MRPEEGSNPQTASEEGGRAPTVSVVLPTYNRAGVLQGAIESVLEQTHRKLELIIVDDGSVDATRSVVERFEDPRIRYIPLPRNGGVSAARNVGIEHAGGEFVAFLDSDDRWAPEKLALQLQRFEETELPAVGVVTCGTLEFRDGGPSTTWVPTRRGWVLQDLLLQRRLGVGPPLILCRRELFTEAGLRFDPELPAREDLDFAILAARDYQLDFVPLPLLHIHHHGGPRASAPDRVVVASARFHEKHETLLREHPRAHRRFHLRVALSLLVLSNWAGARKEVSQAIAADRFHPLGYLWYLFTFLPRGSRLGLAQRAILKALQRASFR